MDKLPINDVKLSSDVSFSCGMAGVLTYESESKDYPVLTNWVVLPSLKLVGLSNLFPLQAAL